VCNNAQETKGACCGFKLFGVRDGTMNSISIHVFDSADLVAESLVATARTMTDRAINTANGDPKCEISWSLTFESIKHNNKSTYSTRITSMGRDHVSFSTAHLLNCSFVTETPTRTKDVSPVVAAPGAIWITLSSFCGSM